MAGRTIFRESAVEAYRRRPEKDVVPRLISWPIVLCLWVLLGIVLAQAWVAWSVRVPSYVGASGVIVGGGEELERPAGETAAVLFLPPDRSPRLRVGQPVHLQVGSSPSYVEGEIAKVEPGLVSPDAARRRFGLEGALDTITEPSTAVVVRLEEALAGAEYGGSRVTARVEVGSRRPVELIPGVGKLVGGGS